VRSMLPAVCNWARLARDWPGADVVTSHFDAHRYDLMHEIKKFAKMQPDGRHKSTFLIT
jgi:hypothetical protein